MNLSLEMLKKFNICKKGHDWYILNDMPGTVEKCSELLIATNEKEKLLCVNWLLTHVFTKEQNVKYAAAADAVAAVDAYDARADYAAAYAAYAAVSAAYAADYAARAAARAAAYAAYAASAAYAAYDAAAYDAYAAAADAYDAAVDDAYKTMLIKILRYGLTLIN